MSKLDKMMRVGYKAKLFAIVPLIRPYTKKRKVLKIDLAESFLGTNQLFSPRFYLKTMKKSKRKKKSGFETELP